ncbi:MAG: hypothetical protein LBB65_08375, partial [Burkholderiales bacterium]|nr:hypothetical protein [Burkholderiales bacterium]
MSKRSHRNQSQFWLIGVFHAKESSMRFRICVFCLKAMSLGASAIPLVAFFAFPAFAATAVEYHYDAAGNIISIERNAITGVNTGSVTSIATGQNESVDIVSGGQAALSFDAQASDLLSFYFSNIVVNPSSAVINYSFYDPSGNLLRSGTINGQAGAFSLPPIPASGTYVLALSVSDNGSADLSIAL